MDDDERLALADALRTPLTSALLAIDLLGGEGLSDVQRTLIASVTEDLHRLRVIVERDLDVARAGRHAGPLERRRVRASDLVERAVEPLLSQAAQRGLALVVDVRDDAEVVADAVKLTWALSALVGNAVRFARRRVVVSVERDDELSLGVHDDGPGVEPSRATSLFARDGSSLSLYLVREVIDAHGGSIALAPRDDGASFRVTLPLAEDSR